MSTPEQDRFEIHQQVLAYCRAVDRLDLPGIRAVYAPDGVDHHTGFDGGADDYVAWLGRLLPRLDGTMHLVGNHLCHLAGDEAASETYGTAVHWGSPADDARSNFTSGFRYVDHWVRLPQGWRVRERWAVREWTRSDAGRITGSTRSGTPSGTAPGGTDPRDRGGHGDPFAGLLARLGGAG